MTTNSQVATAPIVVSAHIIMTEHTADRTYFYADVPTATRVLRAEFRGTGISMRKDEHHVSRMNGGTSYSWNLYMGESHIGYAVIRHGAVDTERAYVLAYSGDFIIAGAYTDTDTDSSDLAIALADIIAKWHVSAQGASKLAWTAPSKLTERQQWNPDAGESWAVANAVLFDSLETGRPHEISAAGLRYTFHVPACEYCTDHAIVSAWQNFRDCDGSTDKHLQMDTAAITIEAHEYTTSPEWSDLGRCRECAGVARGHRWDSAAYAYGRVDQTWADDAPEMVRVAAERVALAIDPFYRRNDDHAAFTLCVRDLTTGRNTWHAVDSVPAAREIARTALELIAERSGHAETARIWDKTTPDTRWVSGQTLIARDFNTLAIVDVQFRAITTRMLNPFNFSAPLGQLARIPVTGHKRATKKRANSTNL